MTHDHLTGPNYLDTLQLVQHLRAAAELMNKLDRAGFATGFSIARAGDTGPYHLKLCNIVHDVTKLFHNEGNIVDLLPNAS